MGGREGGGLIQPHSAFPSVSFNFPVCPLASFPFPLQPAGVDLVRVMNGRVLMLFMESGSGGYECQLFARWRAQFDTIWLAC